MGCRHSKVIFIFLSSYHTNSCYKTGFMPYQSRQFRVFSTLKQSTDMVWKTGFVVLLFILSKDYFGGFLEIVFGDFETIDICFLLVRPIWQSCAVHANLWWCLVFLRIMHLSKKLVQWQPKTSVADPIFSRIRIRVIQNDRIRNTAQNTTWIKHDKN